MSDDADQVLAECFDNGLENGLRRFYSAYAAEVVDNRDPEESGRIMARITDLGEQEATDWIRPLFQKAGKDRGSFNPPDVGDMVRVLFHHGDASCPVAYLPGWYRKGDRPAEFRHSDEHRPLVRGEISRIGHSLIWSEEDGEEFVRLAWHQPEGDVGPGDSASRLAGKWSLLEFTKEGGLTIILNNGEGQITFQPKTAAKGSQWWIGDSYGNSLFLDDQGIRLEDKEAHMLGLFKGDLNAILKGKISFTAAEANFMTGGVSLGFPATMHAVLGEPLLAWLASHTHLSTAPGLPTGPALPPPPPMILSKSVKLKM